MYIDPEAAILRCLETVHNQQDIVIDMINIGGDGKGVIDGSSPPYTQANKENNGWIEIGRVMDKYPDVNYRYILSPEKKLMNDTDAKGFFLTPEQIRQFGLAGEQDAIAQLEKGPGVDFDKLRQSLRGYSKEDSLASDQSLAKKVSFVMNNAHIVPKVLGLA